MTNKEPSDIVDQFIRNKKKSRIWTIIWVAIFCLISIGLIWGILTRSGTGAMDYSSGEDTLYSPSGLPVEVAKNHREAILQDIAMKYIALRTAHNVEGLDSLYADTLNTYFRFLKDVKKEVVKRSDSRYWRKYPNDRFVMSGAPEIILSDSVSKAFIKGTQCRSKSECSDQILELNFNESDKINFVRAYYAGK